MYSNQEAPQLNNSEALSNELGMPDTKRMGDALVQHAKLTQQDIARILELQRDKKILFGEAAKILGLITEEDLQKVLSEQFNYAYLQDGSHKISPLLIAAHNPFNVEVEQLRSLRSQLSIRWFDQGNKTLAVTSVSSDDNASQLVANLAIVFSQLNKKTLLIDANLRDAKLHQLFNIETKMGLANILANRQGQYTLSKIESLPNLTILTAGTAVPNPQELLSRDSLTTLLVDLEKIYDVILIDTSPIHLGQDALTVVIKAKAAIIVAKKDTTMVADMQQLSQQLSMTGSKLIGSIFVDA
jgi:protein-tyrosine kinase